MWPNMIGLKSCAPTIAHLLFCHLLENKNRNADCLKFIAWAQSFLLLSYFEFQIVHLVLAVMASAMDSSLSFSKKKEVIRTPANLENLYTLGSIPPIRTYQDLKVFRSMLGQAVLGDTILK